VARDAEAAEATPSGATRGRRDGRTWLSWELPRADGLVLVRRIRADARLRRTPVVLFTASGEDRDRQNGYALVATSYIQKPTNFAVLEGIVRDLCVYWLVVNRPASLFMGESS